jgi:pimeloyl-ACP methyl ester carboxylesterase
VQAHWWRERAQADALQSGDVSAFAANVDFSKLRAGTTDESGIPKTGHMNRLLASRFSFGQGRDYAKECGGIEATGKNRCEGQMVGQLQTYAVYVPKKPAPPGGYGLTLLLHALSANQNQYLGSRHAEQYGERGAGSVVITPSGRGPDGFYYDVAEADTFETWADIARVYPIDPDWVSISGYSMGGIGTWRLGGRWPDLFARAVPIVASTSTSDNTKRLPSFRNLPVQTWSSALDELQPVVDTEETTAALGDLGLRFGAFRFNTWDHLTPSTNDWYPPAAEFLGEHRVDRDPAHVTYVIDTEPDNPARGVVADHAYWLSGLKPRSEQVGTIDVRSDAFGQADPQPSGVTQSDGVYEGGYQEPAPYTYREQTWKAATAPKADRLVVTATNVATATVDAARARVSCAPAIELKSDGPLELRIACPPPAKRARTAACTKTLRIKLPRVKGARITRASVTRGGRRVATRKGRNLRSLTLRRGPRTAYTLRIRLTTTRGRVTLTRRVAACR